MTKVLLWRMEAIRLRRWKSLMKLSNWSSNAMGKTRSSWTKYIMRSRLSAIFCLWHTCKRKTIVCVRSYWKKLSFSQTAMIVWKLSLTITLPACSEKQISCVTPLTILKWRLRSSTSAWTTRRKMLVQACEFQTPARFTWTFAQFSVSLASMTWPFTTPWKP